MSLAPLSFIFGAALWALLLPRQGFGRLQSLAFELCSGTLLFTAIFLLSLPRYLPKNPLRRIVCGFACAMLTMLLRRVTRSEETVCIAIFLMNFALPYINKIKLKPRPSPEEEGEVEDSDDVVEYTPSFLRNSVPDEVVDNFL